MPQALGQSVDEKDSFPKSAEQLVGYIEEHNNTPLARTHIKHILMLAYCAGIRNDELEGLAEVYLVGNKIKLFVSLHALPDVGEACRVARMNITSGGVSITWKEDFNKQMDAIIKKFNIKNL